MAPQMGVEGCVSYGEHKFAVPDRTARRIGRVEDREPCWPGQLATSDPAALGAHFVQDGVIRGRRDPKLDEFGPAQARHHAGQDHCPVQQARPRVGDDREQPSHFVGCQSARRWSASHRPANVGRRVLLDRAHPPREVVEGRDRGESDRDRGRGGRRPELVGVVGEAVDVQRRR